MNPAELSTFKTLFRLYDLPDVVELLGQASAAGLTVRRVALRDLTEVRALIAQGAAPIDPEILPALLAMFPVPALVARAGTTVVGVGLYDVRSRGTVGPIAVAPDAPSGTAQLLLVHTLAAMFNAGYYYAVDNELPSALSAELSARYGCAIHAPDPLRSATDRDDRDLPWADLFIRVDPERYSPLPRVIQLCERHAAEIRRPAASERLLVVEWVREQFGAGWASEMEHAFGRTPISCFIAVHSDASRAPRARLLGFTAYDCAGLCMGSTIAVVERDDGGRPGSRWPLALPLIHATGSEMFMLGYEYMIASGMSNRLLPLETDPAVFTIPRSYPGPFGKVIAYR